jgi:hypothetical protein
VLFDGPEDIPVFASDEEELEFWRTHAPSDAYVRRMKVGDPLRAAKGRKGLPSR